MLCIIIIERRKKALFLGKKVNINKEHKKYEEEVLERLSLEYPPELRERYKREKKFFMKLQKRKEARNIFENNFG
jgi:hypothetical protein